MQRWKHAGRGPKYTLVVGILLGVASLLLNQNAYAQSQFGYPGNPATPGIPTGPTLGCTPAGSSNASWVCGFNPLTKVTFHVDGHVAGTATSDSNGCVLVVITFLAGKVQINGNAPVPVHQGTNFVTVLGHKTEPGGTVAVGLRLPFATPLGTHNTCAVGPPPPIGGSTTLSTSSTFPIETTAHGFYPTTLAKVIETPLVISPNKVLLETSLLAAVLAAVLSAGALGAMWSSGGASGAASRVRPGVTPPVGAPPTPVDPQPGGLTAPGFPQRVPVAASTSVGISAATGLATPPSVSPSTSAFTRPEGTPIGGGGGA